MNAILLQGGALAVFLGLGMIWPRRKVLPLGEASRINLMTGGLLFGLKVLFTQVLVLLLVLPPASAGAVTSGGAISMAFLTHPLLQFLFVFVLSDLSRYWVHRAHHEVGFLWQFHRVHHSSAELNSTSGLRMHLVDFVQLALVPVLLFKVAFDCSSFDPRVFLWLSAVVVVMDAFQHADLDFPIDHPAARALNQVLNNPFFHAWHHTAEPGKHHCNYGQTLVIWDRMFGSAAKESHYPELLGLDESQALEEGLWGLQRLNPRRKMLQEREA